MKFSVFGEASSPHLIKQSFLRSFEIPSDSDILFLFEPKVNAKVIFAYHLRESKCLISSFTLDFYPIINSFNKRVRYMNCIFRIDMTHSRLNSM